jgi:co-chaperonin GroES (HSP10)
MPINKISKESEFREKSASLEGLAEDLNDLDRKFDPQKIEDDWHREMDDNHEWWESMQYVDKPDYLIKRDEIQENARQGVVVDYIPTPLPDRVIVAMSNNDPQSSKLFITTNITHTDNPIGHIIGLNPDSEYEFKIGTKVLFDISMSCGRLQYDGICIILPKEAILAEFE